MDAHLKNKLRDTINDRRRMLDPKLQQAASKKICHRLINHPLIQQAQHIALYIPIQGEANPLPLMQSQALKNKHWYAPCIKKNTLIFCAFDPLDTTTSRLGTIEPAQQKKHTATLDCIVVPLVAFDRQGFRIGRGHGYYDRSLAPYFNSRTQLIGIAYQFQYIADCHPMTWDVPLHHIITEQQIITV